MTARLIEWALNRIVAGVAVLALAAYVAIQTIPLAEGPIRSDAYSYFLYLPNWLLHADLSLEAVADECCGGAYPVFTDMRRSTVTGRWVNHHQMGEAVLMSPFFVAAHLLTRWSNMPPNGFSAYYQHAAGLAGIGMLVGGLALLRRLLAAKFSAAVTLWTLVVLTFGTNLFHYAVYDGGYSHIYSFFLTAAVLVATDAWWERPTVSRALLMGTAAGLVLLVRYANVFWLLVVPLYGLWSDRGLGDQAAVIWQRRKSVAIALVVGALAVLPQVVLHRYQMGAWFQSPYTRIGGFTFGSPHLMEVLVGVQKGLFFWSPALLVAALGILAPDGWTRRWRVGALAAFALQAYVIASWWDWQFGGSFGHRGFTDALPLAGLFMAAGFAWAWRRTWTRQVVVTASAVCVALSLFQMVQYWTGILPFADMTWERYREIFLVLP